MKNLINIRIPYLNGMKYIDLVRVYKKLESTSKRLEKTYVISNLLEKAGLKELEYIITLLKGKVFPDYDLRKIGVAAKIIIKALVTATGLSQEKIEDEWKKTGDLGVVAKNLIPKKKQQTLSSIDITVSKVYSNIRKLAGLEGQGTVNMKVRLIAELLTSANADEAKYITRTVLETLRIGVGAGAIRDAIVWSMFPKVIGIFYMCECGEIVPNSEMCMECGKKNKIKFREQKELFDKESEIESAIRVLRVKDASELKDMKDYDIILADDEKAAREIFNYLAGIVQNAYDMTNDWARVAITAKEKGRGGLLEINLTVGIPINVMLYKKAKDINDAFNTVGKPAACEYKYDGFRMQIHRKGKSIKLITRRLEEVTDQFPDVIDVVKDSIKSSNYIIDCEIIGIDPKTGKWLPFQRISQRIRRKYDIQMIAKEVPVAVKIFDAMEVEGNNLLDKPFSERRKFLEKITTEKKDRLNLAKQIISEDEKEVAKFYEESLKLGNEGIMMKNMKAPYKPGSRVGYGVKIKPVMESLDLVITAAEWGEGKRSGWLTSFTIACMDEDGNYLEIGKVSTGLKEKEEEGTSFSQMTEEIKPLIISSKGKKVEIKPAIVIEVHYEEIQSSSTYKSGFALRFPRFISKRDDMRPEKISTLDQVDEIYHLQRGR